MTKATTITDTATAVDACRQLALTGLAPELDTLFDDATRRRISHPTFLAEALRTELDIRHERRRARRIHLVTGDYEGGSSAAGAAGVGSGRLPQCEPRRVGCVSWKRRFR